MDLTLHTLTGKGDAAYRTFTLEPGAAPSVIGRSPACDVCLADERISRRHASLFFRAPDWHIIDLGSSQGTFVNGSRIEPNRPAPIEAGDLIRLAGWTFRAFLGSEPHSAIRTIDDTSEAGSRIVSLAQPRPFATADHCLRLLADAMSVFGVARTEGELAEAAAKAALDGSGFCRAAVLSRSGAAEGGATDALSILATAEHDGRDRSDFTFSGSLVRQASGGETALLSGSTVATRSIADLGIHSAICAPFMLGDAVAGFLYLDSRGGESSASRAGRRAEMHSEAPLFCQAVARAYGLALANLKRRELERRQAAIQVELSAAREAQLFILPPREGDRVFMRYAAQMRPGLFVAGDLFDIVPLADGRIAICFGDAAGHGMGSAMLMAATQSHLHAQLQATGDPVAAVSSVNRYLASRLSPGRFVTLFVGVLSHAGELTYTDAGHGYWMLKRAGESVETTENRARGSIPVGVLPDTIFTSSQITLRPDDRLVLFSDGVVEERNSAGEQFSTERIAAALAPAASPEHDVASVFTAFDDFNASSTIQDDATVASMQFRA